MVTHLLYVLFMEVNSSKYKNNFMLDNTAALANVGINLSG